MQSSLITDGLSAGVSRTFMIHGNVDKKRLHEVFVFIIISRLVILCQALNIVANHHTLIRSEFEPSIIPADITDKYACDEDVVICRIQPSIDVEIGYLVRLFAPKPGICDFQ